MFFTKGLESGNSINILNYVWDRQISLSLGYSFSQNHTTPYTGIMLQEMNLAYHYGSMYWKCGCLSVNAGAIGDGKSTNYGKIAKAVCDMQDIVAPPNINLSKLGFNIYNNKILYGLKAVEGIEQNDIDLIFNLRPFTSFKQVLETNFTKTCKANLIKSGALDEFGLDRKEMAKQFIDSIAEYKTSFSSANINMLLSKNLIPSDSYRYELDCYNLYKSIATKSKEVSKDIKDDLEIKAKWYIIDNDIFDNFINTFDELKEDLEYMYCPNLYCYIVKESAFKKHYNKNIKKLTALLSNQEVVNNYNQSQFDELNAKYFDGDLSKWEFDSINYYQHEHELNNVNVSKYFIEDFYNLPFDPIATEQGLYKGRIFYRYRLSLIMGTVLDRDKTRHTVDILTPTGVVTCKLYNGAFNHYNKTISKVLPNGKKKRIEESWFKRGTKILVYGFRDGDQFRPRKYSSSVYQHTVMKITNILDNGDLLIQDERTKI